MNNKEIIYELMRENEYVLGSNKLTLLAIDSFIKSLKDFESSSIEEAKKNIYNLVDIILNSEPKVTPLIHLMEEFQLEIDSEKNMKSVDEMKKVCIDILKRKKESFLDKIMNTINHGSEYVSDNDVIIVHSVSSVVMNILIRAKKSGRNFKVFVLKQDNQKTEQIIKILNYHKINYEVFPEYNLNHIVKGANKLFIGAMSISSDKKVVAAIGTSNIVSLAHMEKLPIMLFVNSLKFSHCDCNSQKVHKLTKKKGVNVEYDMTMFSHDFVPMKLMTEIISEDGKLTVGKIREYFKCYSKCKIH